MTAAAKTTKEIGWNSVLLVGGFSIIFFVLIKLLGINKVESSTNWFIYNLGFAVNFPHFLMSYQLLYWDFRKKITSNYRFIVAAIISPLVLLGFFIYGFWFSQIDILGYIVNAMYFFVGWHYIKQVFGVISVYNVKNKIFYNTGERRMLKGLLYSIWFVSWIPSNTLNSTYNMEGIPYTSLNLPTYFTDISVSIFYIFSVLCLYLAYKKYIREGVAISIQGIIALVALIVWFFPIFSNPLYMLVIPFFHSLQYIVFVWLFKTNQIQEEVPSRNSADDRKIYLKKVFLFLAVPVMTGALFMWYLPQSLDQAGLFKFVLPNAKPFMFAITVFINIHHYFIDHAIWRRDNEVVRKYLFV